MTSIRQKKVFLKFVNDGDETKLRRMLSNNWRLVNTSDHFGNTPLMIAVDKGHYKIINMLLDSGADIDNANKTGQTSLMIATANNYTRIVEILMFMGADVNKTNNDGMTSLNIAASKGNSKIVKMLLELGADINKKNRNKETPLISAKQEGYNGIVKMIIEYILFNAAIHTASVAEANDMTRDEAFSVFKKMVKNHMKRAGDEFYFNDNSKNEGLYKYFEGAMKMRTDITATSSSSSSRTNSRFGKGKSKKPQKRPSSAVCTRAQKLGVRLTLKRNNKRVYKSEEMLRAQIKNVVTKQNKRKQQKQKK